MTDSTDLTNKWLGHLLEVKKRPGRKQIRPNDPIKKKTEEKDKYWIRSFTAYVRSHPEDFIPLDPDFWNEFLSIECRPGKGKRFKSYGKGYKAFLFSNRSFVDNFNTWFENLGEITLKKKYSPGSDNWFVFFDYAARELCSYYTTDFSKPSPVQDQDNDISNLIVFGDFPIG